MSRNQRTKEERGAFHKFHAEIEADTPQERAERERLPSVENAEIRAALDKRKEEIK